MNLSRGLKFASLVILLCTLLSAQQEKPPLELSDTIRLNGVHGRIAHLAADVDHARLFVADEGDDRVDVLDIRTNSVTAHLTGIPSPQSVAYSKAVDRILVTGGGDGSLHVFNGSTLKPVSVLHLGANISDIRLDSAQERMYVGYGDGAIAVLDFAGKKLADIPLKAHPESFELAGQQPRIFVSLPDARSIFIVDSASATVIANWPTKDSRDSFSLALDEANRRLFSACRRPARLQVFDTATGMVVSDLPTVGDANDLFYDPIHSRVYVVGGEGQIAVYAQDNPNHYSALDSVATAAGSRTGLFVPEWNRLFVALREFAGRPAEIRIYQAQ